MVTVGLIKESGFKDYSGNQIKVSWLSDLDSLCNANGEILDKFPAALTRSDIMSATMGSSGPYLDYKSGLICVPSGEKCAQLWLGDRWGGTYLQYMNNDGTISSCNDTNKSMETLGIRITVTLKSTVKYALKSTNSNGVSTWDLINE